MLTKSKCPKLSPISEDDSSLVFSFTEVVYKKDIATLKNNNAAGIDDVLVEQLNKLGPRAHTWFHSMPYACFTYNRIPKVWRHSKIIVILKPGKDSGIPKCYRHVCIPPMSLCARVILNRIAPSYERHIIQEQAGFRPGESCCKQLLNLNQHIKDG